MPSCRATGGMSNLTVTPHCSWWHLLPRGAQGGSGLGERPCGRQATSAQAGEASDATGQVGWTFRPDPLARSLTGPPLATEPGSSRSGLVGIPGEDFGPRSTGSVNSQGSASNLWGPKCSPSATPGTRCSWGVTVYVRLIYSVPGQSKPGGTHHRRLFFFF